MPELVIAQKSGNVLLRVNLHQRTKLILGRSERCDIRLKGPSISGKHALLVEEAGRWLIIDLGSRHGVWVGDQRVRAAICTEEVPVRLGDLYLWFYFLGNPQDVSDESLPADDRPRVYLRSEFEPKRKPPIASSIHRIAS